MLDGRIFGSQDDKEDVGDEGLNLGLQWAPGIPYKGNEQSQAQFTCVGVMACGVLQQGSAEVLAYCVVELRAGV